MKCVSFKNVDIFFNKGCGGRRRGGEGGGCSTVGLKWSVAVIWWEGGLAASCCGGTYNINNIVLISNGGE